MIRPTIRRVLPGGVEERDPWPAEEEFFRLRPYVAGIAADDDRVVLNPYSPLNVAEKEAVALNEAARVVMRNDPALQPQFALTADQEAAFHSYGSPEDRRATVAARLLSGDPSALEPTAEQLTFVNQLANAMSRRERPF